MKIRLTKTDVDDHERAPRFYTDLLATLTGQQLAEYVGTKTGAR